MLLFVSCIPANHFPTISLSLIGRYRHHHVSWSFFETLTFPSALSFSSLFSGSSSFSLSFCCFLSLLVLLLLFLILNWLNKLEDVLPFHLTMDISIFCSALCFCFCFCCNYAGDCFCYSYVWLPLPTFWRFLIRIYHRETRYG